MKGGKRWWGWAQGVLLGAKRQEEWACLPRGEKLARSGRVSTGHASRPACLTPLPRQSSWACVPAGAA